MRGRGMVGRGAAGESSHLNGPQNSKVRELRADLHTSALGDTKKETTMPRK